MYKVPYIQSVGKEYQVVKRGREYYSCGEKYNVEKRGRGSNIIFPFIIRLLGRISSGEEGKGTEILGIKKLNLKTGGMERISSCRELYPLLYLNIGEDNFIPVLLITNILHLEPFDLKNAFLNNILS